MKNKVNYSLYLVTDRDIMHAKTVEQSVELAIKGGCTVVQLREKNLSSLDFYDTALKVKEVTDFYGIPLIINDRVDIALAVGANGIHIGQSDLPASIVKKIAPNLILGVSATSYEEAKKAVADGADYLGVGAMFVTGTKNDAVMVSIDELKKITSAFDIPVVAIGGISIETLPLLDRSGIDGVAVVSAVVGTDHISNAAQELKIAFDKLN